MKKPRGFIDGRDLNRLFIVGSIFLLIVGAGVGGCTSAVIGYLRKHISIEWKS